MNDGDQVERACARLVIGFANAADHRDYDRILALFTDDGVFARPGVSYAGKHQIRTYLKSRPGKMTNRHVISNFEITRFAETAVDGLAYYTVYRVFEAEDPLGEKPLKLDPPMAVGEFRTQFRLAAEGWRLSRLEVCPVFAQQS